MTRHRTRIMLVEPDPAGRAVIVAALQQRFRAEVTCVDDGEACLDRALLEPHDLVITELRLSGMSGLRLTQELRALRPRPVILLADQPTRRDAVQALRAGATDFFAKPFPVRRLLSAASAALKAHRRERLAHVRHHELRRLVRRLLLERRALHERVELVCRELVGAHGRLVRRVTAMQSGAARGQ